jgi:hypothetical protein
VRVNQPNSFRVNVTDPPSKVISMKYLDDTIVRSLTGTEPNARELEAAILVAQSMIRELKVAAREWESALKELNAQKSSLSAAGVN